MADPDIRDAALAVEEGASFAATLSPPEEADDFAPGNDDEDGDRGENGDSLIFEAEDMEFEVEEIMAEEAQAEDMVEGVPADDVPADDMVDDSGAAARAPLTLVVDADAEAEQLRMIEALLFAAAEPLDEASLAVRLPAGADVPALLAQMQERMQGRGVELVQVAGGWRLQTPADLAWLLEDVREERRKLSAAARETLAIIAYHQPVTRAEIEEIRGVAVSKGTVDMLMELGWVRMRGRKRAPGRPVTYGTTDLFLAHFGLEALTDLPGKAELKAAGLLDNRLPPDFAVPEPGIFRAEDEDPLEDSQAAGVEETPFHVDFMEEDGAPAEPEPQASVARSA